MVSRWVAGKEERKDFHSALPTLVHPPSLWIRSVVLLLHRHKDKKTRFLFEILQCCCCCCWPLLRRRRRRHLILLSFEESKEAKDGSPRRSRPCALLMQLRANANENKTETNTKQKRLVSTTLPPSVSLV